MSKKSPLNIENLESLGVNRLAQLLLEFCNANPIAKRKLRYEIMSRSGSGEIAKEIRKRIATIARSGSVIEWEDCHAIAEDLLIQKNAIVKVIATDDPQLAIELLWRLLELASSIYERCYSGHECLNSTFIEIAKDLGKMPAQATPDKDSFVRRTLERLIANNYGQYDGLITNVAPVLGQDGLVILKDQTLQHLKLAPKDQTAASYWLQEIADQMGDVDSFIGQFSEEQKRLPANAAAIAFRLSKHNRPQEALDVLEDVEKSKSYCPAEWDDAKIQVLDALNRPSDAQTARLECYHRTLSAIHLKEYLKRLPGNDDFDAEERALTYAFTFPKIELTLKFFFEWEALEWASSLIIDRPKELDGNYYEYLTNWTQTLKSQYPLAATLLLRAMIDYSLDHAKTARYYHAAKHLNECAQISGKITFPANVEDHERYLKRLQAEHGKKRSFWDEVQI